MKDQRDIHNLEDLSVVFKVKDQRMIVSLTDDLRTVSFTSFDTNLSLELMRQVLKGVEDFRTRLAGKEDNFLILKCGDRTYLFEGSEEEAQEFANSRIPVFRQSIRTATENEKFITIVLLGDRNSFTKELSSWL